MKKVAFVDAPFRDLSPSIQNAVLTAYLKKNFDVENFFVYLDIAKYLLKDFNFDILFSTNIGEMLFISILHPEKEDYIISKIIRKLHNYADNMKKEDVLLLKNSISKYITEFCTSIDWKKFSAICFSISFKQLFASLLMSKLIKQANPGVKIIFGGFMCSGDLGKSLMNKYGHIDCIIEGEGETSLDNILHKMLNDEKYDSFTESAGKKLNINALPFPDYDDYFFKYSEEIFKKELYVEGSRGCVWCKDGDGCTFCNNTICNKNFKVKTTAGLVNEIKYLKDRYSCDSISFVDNCFNCRDLKKFAERMIAENCIFKNMFMELRVPVKFEELILLKQIGVNLLQFGIESLNSKILEKMHKGTKVIYNLEAMKFCEQLNITNISNIIIYYPDCSESEIIDLKDSIRDIYFYAPLNISEYVCSYNSPLYHKLKDNIEADEYYDSLPAEYKITANNHFVNIENKDLWDKCKASMHLWKFKYNKYKLCHKYLLEYSNLNDELKINNYIENKELKYDPASLLIYDYCYEVKEYLQIKEQFLNIDDYGLNIILNRFLNDKVMYKEDNKYLSLALRNIK